jgi:hypothetical protein
MRRTGAMLVALLMGADSVLAFPSLQSLIPNGHNVTYGGVPWPAVGHFSASGSVGLNEFGAAFNANALEWNTSFCRGDADGDGYTNGEELGDPDCTFSPNSAPPSFVGDAWTVISHPGFNDSVPGPDPEDVTSSFTDFLTIPRAFLTAIFNGTKYAEWSEFGVRRCTATGFRRFACDLSAPQDARPLETLSGGTMKFHKWPFGLETLDVTDQRLEGQPDFAAILGLPIKRIRASSNRLTGELNLTQLPATLQELDLSYNMFSGRLNTTGVAFPEGLSIVDLSGNAFSAVVVGPPTSAASNLVLRLSGTVGQVQAWCGQTMAVEFSDGTSNWTQAGPCSCTPGTYYDLASCAPSTAPVPTPAQSQNDEEPGSPLSVAPGGRFHGHCTPGCAAALGVTLTGTALVTALALLFKFLMPIDEAPTTVRNFNRPPTADTLDSAIGCESHDPYVDDNDTPTKCQDVH